jgi:hypothetical protein
MRCFPPTAVLALVLLPGALAARAASGEDAPLRERAAGAVTVRWTRGADREAEAAVRETARVLAEASQALGLPAPPSVEVRLLGSEAFTAAVGRRRGEWALAVAYPSRLLIVVNVSRLGLADDLVTTLAHEAVHLLLGRLEAETGNPVPLWFHEGAAQMLCGRLFAGTREGFLAAAASGTLIPLERLERSFPDEGADVGVAYAQSESFLTYVDRRWPQAPEAVLAAMRRGLDFRSAFREVVGEDVRAVETAWRRDLSRGPPLLSAWLQDNPGLLTWMILGGGGLLLAVAWFLVRLRRRADYERLDRGEPGADGGSGPVPPDGGGEEDGEGPAPWDEGEEDGEEERENFA